MKEIEFLLGDATQPQSKGNKIIAHVCNDLGGWAKDLFWQFRNVGLILKNITEPGIATDQKMTLGWERFR